MTQDALHVKNLSVTFPGTRALAGIDLDVKAGEVHALVGHNGSGKSTFIKVLAGLYGPDAGSEVDVNGEPLTFLDPGESNRVGLRFVHQDLGLVESLNVTENVCLGTGFLTRPGWGIRWRELHDKVRREIAQLGYDIDPRTPVGELPAPTRAAVGVARVLMTGPSQTDARVVLLDEVTAMMPEAEIELMLDVVRRLKSQGVAVVYVSHHLDEALSVADRVTVFRDGKRVITTEASKLTSDELGNLLVGSTDWRGFNSETIRELQPDDIERHASALTVENIDGPTVRNLSFVAEPGRVIGIAGISGSGRDEVARVLIGALSRIGTVRIGNQVVAPSRPDRSVKLGMVLVPADRLGEAILSVQNIRENLALSELGRFNRLGWINTSRERRESRKWIVDLKIKGATPDGDISQLSGGNQQKAILARCLQARPKVLLLDEPTQGVDVGAAAQIHEIIREVSAVTSVVVCSSDNAELAKLCSEVVILRRGRVIGRLSGSDLTEDNLALLELTATTSLVGSPSITDEGEGFDAVV